MIASHATLSVHVCLSASLLAVPNELHMISTLDIASFFSPQDPRVMDAMLPYMVSYYGNPHSRSHTYGWETEDAVEQARVVSEYW